MTALRCGPPALARLAGLPAPAVALAVLLVRPPSARADGVDLAVFEPTPATTGTGFQLQAPEVGASGSWAATAILSYASNPLVLDAIGVDRRVSRDAVVQGSSLLQLGFAYALLGRLELGAHLPLYLQSGQAQGDPHDGFSQPPAKGSARGNLALHAKAQLWRGDVGPGQLAVGASLGAVLPTATTDQYTGSDQPAGRLLVLGSFTPGALGSRLAISTNVGAIVRKKSAYANIAQQSALAWGAGVSYRILDDLWATAELFGEATPSGERAMDASGKPTEQVLSPVEWLAGMSLRAERRLTIGLAAGRGVTDAIGTPDLRGVVTLAFVPGARTVAPIHAVAPSGPDGDADGDGVPDSLDRCPNEPEDRDMFEDSDGCPDPDNDGDGIPDDKDRCPDVAEDKDGFEDLDGCPDPDNDHDGIPDASDRCPDEPETINGVQDDDGCPDRGESMVVLSPDRIETLEPIRFTGQKPSRASVSLLGQVAATLRAHPEILRLRVTVHVQPTRDPDADQARSDKRAQVLRDWLVQWGIAPGRVEPRGFGGDKPLVPPEQRGAAKVNDRVELIILERK
ncbi:MAG TPA: thrombospondin type 3 repeat-containing protein [Kofleriaceae bacterium]|nr:thrombospondin type 3 repeat-containing protein [Kofleriaceae bacterium]